MRVLVFGGTWFIGKEIVRQSVEAGHDVTLFNRGMTATECAVRTLRGDIAKVLDHRDAIRAVRPDVIVHCLCNSEQNARDVDALFADTGAHLIVLSSQDCYDAFQQLVRDRDTHDLPIKEADPTCPIRHYWRGISTHKEPDYDKNLMTARLLAAHDEGRIRPVVFRLPRVYGPGDRQYSDRHGVEIRRILDRRRRLVVGHVDQGRIFTYGFVVNIAAAILHAFSKTETVGRIYNLGETSVRTRRRWADLYAEQAGFAFEHVMVPDELTPAARLRNAGHFIADCSRYLADTGFVEPVPLRLGIQRTLEWGLQHPEVLGPPPDYAAEDGLAEAYAQFVAACDRGTAPPRN